jgi:hypothetical protein
VRRGIANLLAERGARGMDVPVVGLAVTVLKTTVRESLRGITGLYRDLKLDGGINIQRLQAMPQYSRLYPEGTRSEMLDDEDVRRLNDDIRGNADLVAVLKQRQGAPGFYERLYSSVDTRARCPWLENALYVSTQGDLVACCHIKNYAQDRLGTLDSGVGGALRKRAAMQEHLRRGQIPGPCAGCSIAHGIALRALSGRG